MDNDPCFNESSSEDGCDVKEDGLEFCEHWGEIVQRSTHNGATNLASDSDEEDDNPPFWDCYAW